MRASGHFEGGSSIGDIIRKTATKVASMAARMPRLPRPLGVTLIDSIIGIVLQFAVMPLTFSGALTIAR